MTISEIKAVPSIIGYGVNGPRVHESCLRSYQILSKVKQLIGQETPSPVILEIIEEMESGPEATKEI